MPQPNELTPPEKSFTNRNRSATTSTASPLTNESDYDSITNIDARLAAINLGKLATAVATGSTTTVVINSNEAFRVPNGSLIEIRDSSNAIKSSGSGKTVTAVDPDTPSVGLTRITFTTAAAANVVAGDYIALTTKPFGGSYDSTQLNKMTVNDKIFALRKADDSATF
jgi:hypothetical protein